MLFRIQTVWLLLAAVTLGLIFVLDLYRFPNGQEITILNQYVNTIIAALNVAVILLAIVRFKNLKSQLYLALTSVLLNMVLLGLIFLDINSKNMSPELSLSTQANTNLVGGNYLFGAFAPMASIVFAFLALRGIRKDRKTIKDAYQRLR